MALKDIIWEYEETEFSMAQMNFMGRQGWEAWAISPKSTRVYYRRKKK